MISRFSLLALIGLAFGGVLLAQVTPAVLPYSEGFEGASPANLEMQTTGTFPGLTDFTGTTLAATPTTPTMPSRFQTVTVLSTLNPSEGSNFLLVDYPPNTSAVLKVGACKFFFDLSAYSPASSSVTFECVWADANNDDNATNGLNDAVFLSDDGGTTWVCVYNFPFGTTPDYVWTPLSLNLSQLAVTAGLSFTNQFVVNLQSGDDYDAYGGIDGFAVDDVKCFADTEIDVQRPASNSIADGSTDNVGTLPTHLVSNFTWTIANVGGGVLILNGAAPNYVTVTPGAGSPVVNITAQPTSPIQPATSTTFTIEVQPQPGPFTFVIEIANSDIDESLYDITVSGTGLANAAAAAAVSGGSAFSGTTNGPFTMDVGPGGAIANASIELTDLEGDQITVNTISLQTAQPTGIAPPLAPAPGQPITLTWSGTADATNPPGDYTWRVTFQDAANGSIVMADVTFTILDVQPTHSIVNATGGTGTAGDPYTAGYFPGDTGALSVDLAAATDPNTGQVLSLANAVQVSGPTGGTGFQFALSGGTLTVMPGGTLTGDDSGTQSFIVVISDGTNNVQVLVDVFVFGSTGSIQFLTSPSLTAGVLNVPYGPESIQVFGGTAPYTFEQVSGGLPAGLTMSATGEVSGTPTVTGSDSITVRVVDANNDTAVGTFSLMVRPPEGKGGSGTTRTETSECSGTHGGTMPLVVAVLALGILGAARIRTRRVV